MHSYIYICYIDKILAFALAREIPDQTEPRRQIVPPVVELQVAEAASANRLFVVPARTEVELPVLGKLVVVLNIERLHVGVRAVRCLQAEIAHAHAGKYQDRIG